MANNRFINGVFNPPGVMRGKHNSRVITASSKKRQEPIIHSKLDGLFNNDHPKICLYRRLGGIGDVVMTTPLAKHIKRLMPRCHLVYATDLLYANGALGDVLRGNPFIDEIISYRTVSAKDYDLFTDLTATGLSKEKTGTIPPNRIDMFASQLGIDVSMDPVPTYVVSEDEKLWAKSRCEEYCLPRHRGEITLVGIHARSNDIRRTWPIEYTEQLIRKLIVNPKVRVLIFDWDKNKQWNFPQTFVVSEEIRYASALINECDVMVVPDSALLHIAGALQKKTIAIFGPIPPESRINHYINTTAVVAGVPCAPCWYTHSCGDKQICMTGISPDTVHKAIIDKLAEEEKIQEIISIQDSKVTGFQTDNIVLVKRHYGGFGDILMTLPGIEALKKKYPSKKVYYAIPKKYWPAVENVPFIDKVLDVDQPIQQNRYSVVIDISSPCAQYETSCVTNNKPVTKNRVEVFSSALGVTEYTKTSLKPKFYVSEAEKRWAKNWLPKTTKKKLAIVMRCAEIYRDWPIEKYEELISRISKKYKCIILDPVREFDLENTVDGCGFPFRKSTAIVSQCDGVLTPDTSILHIAAALEIPAVALFGPIDAKARCKGYDKATAITADMKCIPCWRNANTICKQTGKTAGFSACMENLEVSAVEKAIEDMFKV